MKNTYILIQFLICLCAWGCNTKAGGTSEDINEDQNIGWKVLGPGGGGGVLKPTISPFDGNFVITHCDMTGVYVSHDGGKNWKMKNLWNVPEDFEFDPVDSNTIYIATRGFLYSEDRGSGISLLLRSDDKGEKWRIIYPDVSKSKEIERLQSTRIKPSELIDGTFDGTIQKVKVDPADNKKIYLGIAPLIDYMAKGNIEIDDKATSLIISEDRGNSWKMIARLPGKSVLGIFPGDNDNYVTVFTESSCVKVNTNTGETRIFELPVVPIIAIDGGRSNKKSLLYIQSVLKNEGGIWKGGMYISSDMGVSWTQNNKGLLNNVAEGSIPDFRHGMAVCDSKPEVAYISTTSTEKDKKGQPDEIYSLFKTVNGGESWEPVLVSSIQQGYITNNFNGSWMEKSFDPGWGGSPIDLGVAPGNPDICFAGDNGRGYKTTDGGKTWEQVYSHNNPDGSYSNTGLNVTTCYGIHSDPFDKNHYFICYTDIGLFHSFNGGKSWFHSIKDIPREWQNTCYQVAFDPEIKGKVWSVWANAHDLPRAKMFNRFSFEHNQGGIAVSYDGGRTWQKSNKGIPENSVCTNILIDSVSGDKMHTLYVSVFGKGIYKSTDNGKSWKFANKGIENNLFAWQLRQNSGGRLFALFTRGSSEGKVIGGEIYYSDNKAASWKQMLLPEGVNGPHDLLIDPKNADIMYVSCWPRELDSKDKHGGVFKTEDGGKSWKQVFDDRVRVNSAGLDPEQPSVIYINTFQNAAYRSTDYGESWKQIEGYRFKWGQRAIPDIQNHGMLFLTTYGGSVFYGPATGTPHIADDIENMPEGWW
ncbi:MAG: hypothetical protein KUL83_08940 [Lentimicrobium sp.]|nr:hypothetical protein [Lentimicrobium sp.]